MDKEKDRTHRIRSDDQLAEGDADTGVQPNVLQSLTSPDSRPRVNHSTRCSELPWVKLSGLARRPAARMIRSSPTEAAAPSASSTSPGSITPRLRSARLAHTPARQSAC